ncbi:hypothetical protein FOWG_16812 [Fusarium oxysporum f. sp. lycopersici MN25]|nr:hypothetical protein FOWG_16812 [Fusarium oxysporum f. sp. lycopersici MN25]
MGAQTQHQPHHTSVDAPWLLPSSTELYNVMTPGKHGDRLTKSTRAIALKRVVGRRVPKVASRTVRKSMTFERRSRIDCNYCRKRNIHCRGSRILKQGSHGLFARQNGIFRHISCLKPSSATEGDIGRTRWNYWTNKRFDKQLFQYHYFRSGYCIQSCL